MSTYNSGGEPPEMTTVRSPAAAGYCRLRTYDPKATVDPSNMQSIPNEDPSVLCVGSPCTPNMTPSLFEAYYTTEKRSSDHSGTPDGPRLGQDLPSRLHREIEMACLCQNRHPPDLKSETCALPFPPAQAYAWAKLKTLGSAEDDARRRRSLALLHCLAGRIRAKQRSGSAVRQGAARMAALRAELQHLSYQAEPRAGPVRPCAVARVAQRPARTRA